MSDNEFLMRKMLNNEKVGVWTDFYWNGKSVYETDKLTKELGNPSIIMGEITTDALIFYGLERNFYNVTPREKYGDSAIERIIFANISEIEVEIGIDLQKTIILLSGPINYYLIVKIVDKNQKTYFLKSLSFQPLLKLIELAKKINVSVCDPKKIIELAGCETILELENEAKKRIK